MIKERGNISSRYTPIMYFLLLNFIKKVVAAWEPHGQTVFSVMNLDSSEDNISVLFSTECLNYGPVFFDFILFYQSKPWRANLLIC